MIAAASADETPEGRSIVALREVGLCRGEPDLGGATPTIVPFSATTRLSGLDAGER